MSEEGSESALAEGMAQGLLNRYDASVLLRLLAGHAGAMAHYAGRRDSGFIDEYTDHAVLNRTLWDVEHLDADTEGPDDHR